MAEETVTFHEELTALDAFFLHAERSEAPLHAGAVYIFDGQPLVAGGRGARGVARTLEERLHLAPRYRQRVRFRPLNLGHPVWVDDPDFDLGHHVRFATLARPGTDDLLLEYAAEVWAERLDVRRPLWELHVVDGLSGGRVALITKVHHAMVDGTSTVDIATVLLDPDPESPAPAPRPWRPRPAPDDLSLAMDTLDGLHRLANVNPLTLPFKLPGLVRGAAQEAMASPWAGAATLALSLVRPGPQLFFNRLIGPDRRLHNLVVPLAELKEIQEIFAATVDDVVLAVVAEATSQWLEERGEPRAGSMRVLCPVSVRDVRRRHPLGSHVSGVVVDLPIGPMPPVTRLARIVAATGELERTGQAVAAGDLSEVTSWVPGTLHVLGSRLASEPRVGLQSRVNMVVTNVPGPRAPFYTGGARMLEVWPFAPVRHTLGLNVALVSYDGGVHIGLSADRDLVPDLERFAGQLEGATAEFTAMARRLRRPFTRGRSAAEDGLPGREPGPHRPPG
ncbi:MAG TPA: wax ester/triacylglycerol synthase family O-acyltransferase [Candidatus Dormibacteraeota bacterium]